MPNLHQSFNDFIVQNGLEKEAQALKENGFDTLQVFEELEEEDLDYIGIITVGSRKKILKAVKLLKGNQSTLRCSL